MKAARIQMVVDAKDQIHFPSSLIEIIDDMHEQIQMSREQLSKSKGGRTGKVFMSGLGCREQKGKLNLPGSPTRVARDRNNINKNTRNKRIKLGDLVSSS